MAQRIRITFKNNNTLTYKVEEVFYLVVEEEHIDFALNDYKDVDVIELEQYQHYKKGCYRIPLSDIKFAGLEFINK